MNIAEILKDYPKGTRLYSPVYGLVRFLYIDNNSSYPIVVETSTNSTACFAADGRFYTHHDGECMLFLSKENRDWSTFKVPKKEYEFKPFDKVLVRDTDDGEWCIELFSYIEPNNTHKYVCLTTSWDQCIPYEGNEHLLGTSNPA